MSRNSLPTAYTYYASVATACDPLYGMLETATDADGRITKYEYNNREEEKGTSLIGWREKGMELVMSLVRPSPSLLRVLRVLRGESSTPIFPGY